MGDIKTVAEDVLLEIGGNPANKGFVHIVSAMQVINENPELRFNTGDLYVAVAKKHNVKMSLIERNIRTERENILFRGNSEGLRKYSMPIKESCPNGKFLATLYLAVNRKMGGNADAD